ncbi:MAG: hydrolase TatD [Parcubacteria group bacterium CG10_big_fil_rev_8_21_14_0_10_36_14]|nr:MAG: hydrolase TatD [Parcubacteria group bacterium CG10_big_fil_rev_8_21_14_0_10_36_14]
MLIDTHAHLNFSAYKDDLDEVIDRTLENNTWVINVGSQSTTSERAVGIANKYEEGIYAAVGLHPTHLFSVHIDESEVDVKFKSRAEDWDYEFYKKLAQDKKVVAIGEMGLDYNFIPDNVDRKTAEKKQQEVFRKGLDLADELDLPIIIHNRDVHDEIIPILNEYVKNGKLKRRGVIHCYTGGWQDAERYMDLGFLIGFTGIITFSPRKNNEAQQEKILEVARNIPMDKFMIETDCPYLTPEPNRGKRNEPLFVRYVMEKIAEIKKVTFDEIINVSTKTARDFFKI